MVDPQAPREPSADTGASVWQSLLVLPALGSLGLGVLLPLWLLAVLVSTSLSVYWCQTGLQSLSLQSPDRLLPAFVFASVLVLGGLGAATWARLRESLAAHPEAGAREAKEGWLLRNPWWGLGLVLLAVDLFLHRGSGWQAAWPQLAATIILARTSWFILTAAWLATLLSWKSLRLGWRLARRSAFVAGLLVAAGVLTTVGWVGFFGVFSALAQEGRPALQQALREAGLVDHRAPRAESVVPALFERGQLGTRPTAAGTRRLAQPGFWDDDLDVARAAPFSACAEGLDSLLRRQAEREATRYLDSTEAQDVVQDVLLRVCLHGRSPATHPGYFIRSVQNRAREWRRRAARTCSLFELPEPTCELQPDEQYLRAESSRAVNRALCTLSDGDRQLLQLRFFEQWEYADIAASLGVTQDTARQRVSRAARKFKEAFQQRCQ